MSQTIAESLDKLNQALINDKTALTEKKVEVPDTTKHSDIAPLIEGIKTTREDSFLCESSSLSPKLYSLNNNDWQTPRDLKIVYDLEPTEQIPVDVSSKGDNSIIAWRDDNVIYISSKNNIQAPVNSSQLFYGSGNVNRYSSIELNNFHTDYVENMKEMFAYQAKMTGVFDCSNLNTSKVTNMHGMFAGYDNISGLLVDGFDTSKVTDFGSMFYRCSTLTNLSLSSFSFESATTLKEMFKYCRKLISIELPQIKNAPAELDGMFIGCDNIEYVDLRNMIVNGCSTKDMFSNCCMLKKILCDTDWVISINNETFTNCANLPNYDINKRYAKNGGKLESNGGYLTSSTFPSVNLTIQKSGQNKSYRGLGDIYVYYNSVKKYSVRYNNDSAGTDDFVAKVPLYCGLGKYKFAYKYQYGNIGTDSNEINVTEIKTYEMTYIFNFT